jgi:predicted MPP superfamily phosphohydrolase
MKTYLLSTVILLAACSGGTTAVTTTSTTVPATSTTIPNVQPIRIAAVGDISCKSSARTKANENQCRDADVANVIANYGTDYVFLLGDIQYENHRAEEFNRNFGAIWLNKGFDFRPIPGNHEYAQSNARDYYDIWFGEQMNGYYAFDINDKWRVVALNSNDECRFVGCDKSSDQYAWLEGDLQAHSDKCVIAMIHAPRYSSGAHGSAGYVKQLFDLMAGYGVLMVLSGHDHHYERVEIYGEPKQYVVGTGGKNLRGTGLPVDGSAKIVNKYHGALFLDILGVQATEKFIDIDGTTHDSASTSCAK